MSDILQKCLVCRGLLDEEDLFCPNCGTEAPSTEKHQPPAAHTATHNFQCEGCGASMSYDASAGTLRCPFCGSDKLVEQPDAKEIEPSGVVPFVWTKDQAVAAMRRWLGRGMWRPGDLSEQAAVVSMTSVYVPYWVFDAKTHTYWTADTNQTPAGARGDWYPLSGEHHGDYSGLLVGASGVLSAAETTSLMPFDLSRAVPPAEVDLVNATFERFSVQRKYARPLAHSGLESLETAACGKYVRGRSRNLKVNVRVTDLVSRPLLVPVWIMAYRYQEKVFRFLVNGQTGTPSGQAPLSWRKMAVAVVAVTAVIAVALFFLLSGRR